ncbi:PQQ-dependent sugar dehydrogenase [soil metagenome]
MAVAATAFAGSAYSESRATLGVRVDMRDFSLKLSRRSVPIGSTVRFVVRNRGVSPHDFAIAGKKTRLLRRGESQTLTVTFRRKGRYAFLCRVSGHARLGMRGTFSVGAAPPPPSPASPPVVVSGTARLTRIGAFERPVFVTAPPGDTERIIVVEQTGTVRVVQGGQVLPEPFLDLRGRITDSGESGLLSIAFAPEYAESGVVYAFYNSRQGAYGDIRIAELRRDAVDPDIVDPSYERVLLTIPKPYENHNGGMLQFGADGYLYASIGDGDPGVVNPAGFFSQRLDVLLGSILRIDPRSRDPYAVPADNPFVGVAGARPEIWAYGLRNPWFWIDHQTGSMIIADVGSTSREELDLVPPGASGLNFGWPCFEGSLVFDAGSVCERPVGPLLEFPRANGVCAVIGGVVTRDERIPALAGRYLYGDLCTGKMTAISIQADRVTAADDLGLELASLTSFGVDGFGRVYLTSADGVYRLDPSPAG